MKWLDKHFKLLWVLVVLTVATIAMLITCICEITTPKSEYFIGAIVSGVILIIEIISWISFARWLIKQEKNKEVEHGK